MPNSIIKRALDKSKRDVKNSRALLRKYFGVFLTNKILKEKVIGEDILKSHKSSKKRNYQEFYKNIFFENEKVGSIIDLGCGVNGFSYNFMYEVVGNIDYVGIEASGQLVEFINKYFKEKNLSGNAISLDLFDINAVLKILKKKKKPRIVFMFQIIDALENLKFNFSKKFIFEISKECEKIILSLSTESLGGRKKFLVKRSWIIDFLEQNFIINRDFRINGERFIIFSKK